jgi:glycosyltransferase involved in cell wall biosynthesis
VPVVAFRAGAVPETLGDAGLLLDTKRALVVAGAVARVLRDQPLRRALVAAGRQRAGAFDRATTAARLLSALMPVLDSHACARVG